MRRRALPALLVLLPGAALSAEEEPGLVPPPGARLPLGLMARDTTGQRLSLGAALGGLPAVFAFADYDCQTLCGTALGLAAAMLPGTGLRPGKDYRLILLSLDPEDGPAVAAAMRRAWLGEGNALAETARFLIADGTAVTAAMQALGYRARRRGQGFDHPLVLLVLHGDGRLVSVLPALGATPEDLRAALRQAAGPEALGMLAQVRLLCQAVTPSRDGALRGALAAGGAATLALLGGSLLLLRRRERRA